MRYPYYICDVFTETRFGGNQLAVLTRADGLPDARMQQIAREFNFAETTFVLPPKLGGTREVRIFTPAREIPFAGHPNLGTAFILAAAGELGEIRESSTVTFEEKAGLVRVTVHAVDGKVSSCELAAPQPLSLGKTFPAPLLASALSLLPQDIVTETHAPQVASVGLPFVFVELRDLAALGRARADIPGLEAILADGVQPDVYLYTRTAEPSELRSRMFAPLDGVPEDPATGSAACALAGLLAHLSDRSDGAFRWRIRQGVEMGRPSTLVARAEKRSYKVTSTGVGGACVLVSEGLIQVE